MILARFVNKNIEGNSTQTGFVYRLLYDWVVNKGKRENNSVRIFPDRQFVLNVYFEF